MRVIMAILLSAVEQGKHVVDPAEDADVIAALRTMKVTRACCGGSD